MLPESRILTCIDNDAGFAVHFLEGQKLIHDLALLHDFTQEGFSWFRDCVLSVQPMVSLLKQGEGFGFFLDGTDPAFKLNFETGFHGQMRALLTPRDFSAVPGEVTGHCRLVKIQPGDQGRPWQSIIEVDGLTLPQIINRVLEASFQMQSEVLISETSDQSVMFSRLPDGSGDDEQVSAREYRLQWTTAFRELFERALTDEQELIPALEALGLKHLAGREIAFSCSCSEERMTVMLKQLVASGQLKLGEDEQNIETRCEYCNTAYTIPVERLLNR